MLRLLRVLVGWLALIGTAQAATTTTTLAVTANGNPTASVSPGTVVTLIATVQAGSALVSPGQVKFCDADAVHCTDIHLLAMAQLTSAGTASFKFIPGTGSHHYKAVFAGTNSDAGSSSAVSTLAVSSVGAPGVSTAALAATGGPGNYTLTATVTGNGSTSPTGSVSFLDANNFNFALANAGLQVGATGLALQQKSALATGQYPGSIITADFNGDGIPDLAVANDGLNTNAAGSLSIYLGNSDGTFRSAPSVATGNFPGGFLTGDFNGDGRVDLAITTGFGTIDILLGNGDGTFTAGQSIPGAFSSFAAAAGDVNGDGNQDLIGVSQFAQTVFILSGHGDGTFTLLPQTSATGDNPLDVSVGDFNGDGKLDLVVENVFAANSALTPAPLTVLLGNGDGTFTPTASPTVGIGPEGLAVADFNGDGKLDVAVVNIQPPASIMVLLGKGDGTFGAPISTAQVDYINAIAVGDFNGDGKPDLAAFLEETTPEVTQNVLALLGDGDGTFTNRVGGLTNGAPFSGVVADFDGDGKPDIASLNQVNGVSIFLSQWSGAATATVANISPIGLGIHDVDAVYSGDTSYAATTSSSTPLTGVLQPTTLVLTANPSSSASGESVTLSVSLAPDAAQNHDATGFVTFQSGGNTVGTESIANGVATWTGTTLPAGSDSLMAVYAGDNDFATSTSNSVPFNVGAATSSGPLVEPVGSTSAVQTATVTITTAGQLAKIDTLTQGVAGLDFNLVPGGSCSVGTAYSAGQTCVLEFSITPTHPGQRFGGAVFTTASGTVLATSYFYGVGTGPQVTFSPGTQTALAGTVTSPAGIAVDGAGDVFVASYGSGLYEIPVSGQPHSIGTFVDCEDVTVDGVGNVFVLSGNTTLSEVLAVNGTVPASPTIVTLTSQFHNVTSVKVDGLGNVYISSQSASGTGGEIYKVLAVDGSIPASPTVQTLSRAFSGATGVAVDVYGNLYVSDQTQNGVFEVLAVNGSIPASPTILTLATGLNLPSNITLDAAGDVFVSDYGDSDVKEILAVGGSIPASNPTILSLGSGLATPQGLFVDPSGNVFVADSGLTQAVELNYANPPALSFAPTIVGQTSSDSPKSVTLTNDGNAPLIFATPGSGFNPAISPGFTLGDASTCPLLAVNSASSPLAAGGACTDLVSFTPTSVGTISGQLVTTDNALNRASATQIVPLNGVALNLTAPTITFSVANQTLGNPPFTVAAVSNSPGAITYSVVSGPATISGSTVTLTGAGSVELQASQVASGIYAAGTATATFNVAKEPQTITFAPLASPLAAGSPPVTLVATASSGLPVSFSVLSGPATVSGTLLTFTGTGTVVVAANQAGNAQYAAAPTVTQTVLIVAPVGVNLVVTPNLVFLNNPVTLTATLSFVGPGPSGTVSFLDGTVLIGTAPLSNQTATLVVSTLSLGTHSITAIYGGNTLYAAAASPAAAITVEDFGLALTNPNLTIVHGGTATFLLSVSESNPAGTASTVDLAVTGAPDGSQITLTPASIAAGAVGTTPVTLVIQTPNYPSGPWATNLRSGVSGGTTLAASLLAGGLMLPLGFGIRRRVRRIGGGLLAVLAFAGLLALGGCGSGWRTQVWTVHVTATSGQLSHTVAAVLTSKCEDGQAACPIVTQ